MGTKREALNNERRQILAYLAAGGAVAIADFARAQAITNPRLTGIFSFGEIDARDYSLDTSGNNSVAGDLNRAFADGAANDMKVRLPTGTLAIDDTLHAISPDATTRLGAWIYGQGGIGDNGGPKTIIDATAITTLPAISVDRVHGGVFEDFKIVGGNHDIGTALPNRADRLYGAEWVDSGASLRDNRYSPYCGIGIDTYTGTDPGGGNGYPSGSYIGDAGGCLALEFNRVMIEKFVVGVAHGISTAVQGDTVQYNGMWVEDCKVAIAVGESNNNQIIIQGGWFSGCRTVYDALEYGDKQGKSPIWTGAHAGGCFELFSLYGGATGLVLNGAHLEFCHRLGQIGVGTSNSQQGATINTLAAIMSDDSNEFCPIFIESDGFVKFNDIEYSPQDPIPYINMLGRPIVLDGGQILASDHDSFSFAGKRDVQRGMVVRNLRVKDASAYYVYAPEYATFSLPSRINGYSNPHQYTTGNDAYRYQPKDSRPTVECPGASSYTFSDTELDFTHTAAGTELLVGDTLLWQLEAVGKSGLQHIVPALVITGIDGTDVTCELMHDRSYYDEAYAPSSSYVVANLWAAGAALTGDTNTSTSLTNVSPTTVLKNGDFIDDSAGHIPVRTRVVSGEGTATITLSKAATGSSSGVALYWDRLYDVSAVGSAI